MNAKKELVTGTLDGMVQALSPICHMSGETVGKGKDTVDQAISFEVVAPTGGEPNRVLVFKGNALRGILREVAAEILGRQIGGFRSLNDYRLYFSGGTSKTAEKGAGDSANIAEDENIRGENPFVGLLGGQIKTPVAGNLKVGNMMPYVEATKHLIPKHLTESEEINIGPASDSIDKTLLVRQAKSADPRYSIYLRDEARE